MTFTHQHTWMLDATPDRIFRALTEPTELTRWFAEHALVEPRVGGAYHFWGRHTLGTPTRNDARQTMSVFEPDAALGYSWETHGVNTDVSISLTPTEKGTTLALTHAVRGDLGVPRQRALIHDHWLLVIGNLASHLAGRAPLLPNFSDPNPEVRLTIPIDAPPHVVFLALIEPERINRWFGTGSSVVEPRVGGRYDLQWKYTIDGKDVDGGPTKILEFEQDKTLVLDWPDWRGDATVVGQTIRFVLEPTADGGTILTFIHAGFGRTADMGDYGFGWGEFLAKLQQEATRP